MTDSGSDDRENVISLLRGRKPPVAPGKPAPARQLELKGDHLNAARFLEEHGGRVRWSNELGRWLLWNGSHWFEDRLEGAQELGRQTIDGLRVWAGEATDPDDMKARIKHYGESARVSRRDGMLAVARTDASVVVAAAELDRRPNLLACENGTVDLRTGELHDSEPDDLLTRGVGLEYDPGARSDEWEAFLATIFAGDAELTSYARRLLGYATTGEVGEHILAIFYGTGANGKSAFITAVSDVLGGLAAIAPEGLLTESKHEQHPERLAALRGRRLIVSSELEQRAILAEGLVKSITGGDRISARHLYGQRFEFEPTHTMILVTNHAPRVRGTDEAIWRRLRLVPFTVTIPVGERVTGYGHHLAERNGEAILAWLVAGAGAWYRDGLGQSRQVEQATEGYRKREDVFSQFLEERTVQVKARTALKELHGAWREWAEAQGIAVGRTKDFSDWLLAHGLELETYQGARFVRGVGIMTESASDLGSVRSREGSSVNLPIHAHASESPEETSRDLTDPSSEAENGLIEGLDFDEEERIW